MTVSMIQVSALTAKLARTDPCHTASCTLFHLQCPSGRSRAIWKFSGFTLKSTGNFRNHLKLKSL